VSEDMGDVSEMPPALQRLVKEPSVGRPHLDMNGRFSARQRHDRAVRAVLPTEGSYPQPVIGHGDRPSGKVGRLLTRRLLFTVALATVVVIVSERSDAVWVGTLLYALLLAWVVRLLRRRVTKGQGKPPSVDPLNQRRVRVDDVGQRWIYVVRTVRQHTGLSARDVRAELSRRPAQFLVPSTQVAEELVQALSCEGATATVEPRI
jgi:hypothetical protein